MTPGSLRAPPPGSVDLWTIDLAQHEGGASVFARALDREELARAARLRFAVHRTRFIVRHYAYRAILCAYAGCEPRDLVFTTGIFGKPSLARPDLDYNPSHSETVAMLAVTGGSAVGLDVERVRDLGDQYEWLSVEERRSVVMLPPEDRTTEALRMWTRKEAYVKALGVGVTALDGSMRAPPACAARPPLWTLIDLDPCAGYVACLAVPFERPLVAHRRWAPAIVAPVEMPAR